MGMDLITWQKKPRTIGVVVDNDSWILPYAEALVEEIKNSGDHALLHRSYETLPKGQVAFFLGCVTKAAPEILTRSIYNLVVHESALPQGRGFAPMTWQILEGKNNIPISLIEAVDAVDAGAIYLQSEIKLLGTELAAEWRDMQGKETLNLCLAFLQSPEPPIGQDQQGEPSFYKRRTPKDSALDPNKTIAEQFDLLRVCDNERYPAHLTHRGQAYTLKIERVK